MPLQIFKLYKRRYFTFINMLRRVRNRICPFCRAFFKKWFFLFRWWLIGRNFCDMPKWSKKWWVCYIANKLLWSFIAYCLICVIMLMLGFKIWI